MARRAGKPETAKTLTVLPVQLRPGDTFTDDSGTWEIVGQPRSQRAGKSVAEKVQHRREHDRRTSAERLMKDMIVTLYEYGRWANERLLAKAGDLSQDQLAQKLTQGADPILETFGHLVSADVRWFARWRGEAPPAISKTDFHTLDEVRKRWNDLYPARGAYIASLDEEQLLELMTWTPRERPIPIPRWQAMVHCANHGTQHRSEIAAMLTDLGHSPGDLDMVLFCVDHPRG